MSRTLIIVEGDFEVRLISEILRILDVKVYINKGFKKFTKEQAKDNNACFLVKGNQSQILSLLKRFDKNQDEISFELGIRKQVASNFFVYDVDMLNYDDLLIFIPKFSSPVEGLVVLSNPCIETISDNNKQEFIGRARDYKARVRKDLSENGVISSTIIIEEFLFCLSILRHHCHSMLQINISK